MPVASKGAARRSESLTRLEESATRALHETVASCRKPAMLFSAGKDSCVMLHLARKAFAPAVPPFPLLHVDTTWEFPETYPFRDRMARDAGMELIVQVNREGARRGIGPFTHGAREHTRVMKSEALREALERYGFDAVIDGARGDEERFRAQARMRAAGSGQSAHPQSAVRDGPVRAFPLADWTELDVWRYIALERIEVPELYFAAYRPVLRRDGLLIVRVDERMPLQDGEEPENRSVRFRSLGCWPLTGAVESSALDVPSVLRELRRAGTSEREGRAHDQAENQAGDGRGDYF